MLQHLKEGFVAAAELVALLFVPPALGSEPALHEAGASRVEIAISDDHAQLTVARRVSNSGDAIIDLAQQLPPPDKNTASLRVVRGHRVVDLIVDVDCGDDAPSSGETAHVKMAADEAIADALQLPPGESAWIEMAFTHTLQGHGAVQRIELPFAAAAAHGFVTDRSGASAVLLVTLHPTSRGRVELHLRPARSHSQLIDLGVVERPGTAFLITLEREALLSLSAGAIELETRQGDASVWSTLPLQINRTPAVAVDVSR